MKRMLLQGLERVVDKCKDLARTRENFRQDQWYISLLSSRDKSRDLFLHRIANTHDICIMKVQALVKEMPDGCQFGLQTSFFYCHLHDGDSMK